MLFVYLNQGVQGIFFQERMLHLDWSAFQVSFDLPKRKKSFICLETYCTFSFKPQINLVSRDKILLSKWPKLLVSFQFICHSACQEQITCKANGLESVNDGRYILNSSNHVFSNTLVWCSEMQVYCAPNNL